MPKRGVGLLIFILVAICAVAASRPIEAQIKADGEEEARNAEAFAEATRDRAQERFNKIQARTRWRRATIPPTLKCETWIPLADQGPMGSLLFKSSATVENLGPGSGKGSRFMRWSDVPAELQDAQTRLAAVTARNVDAAKATADERVAALRRWVVAAVVSVGAAGLVYAGAGGVVILLLVLVIVMLKLNNRALGGPAEPERAPMAAPAHLENRLADATKVKRGRARVRGALRRSQWRAGSLRTIPTVDLARIRDERERRRGERAAIRDHRDCRRAWMDEIEDTRAEAFLHYQQALDTARTALADWWHEVRRGMASSATPGSCRGRGACSYAYNDACRVLQLVRGGRHEEAEDLFWSRRKLLRQDVAGSIERVLFNHKLLEQLQERHGVAEAFLTVDCQAGQPQQLPDSHGRRHPRPRERSASRASPPAASTAGGDHGAPTPDGSESPSGDDEDDEPARARGPAWGRSAILLVALPIVMLNLSKPATDALPTETEPAPITRADLEHRLADALSGIADERLCAVIDAGLEGFSQTWVDAALGGIKDLESDHAVVALRARITDETVGTADDGSLTTHRDGVASEVWDAMIYLALAHDAVPAAVSRACSFPPGRS